MGSESDSILNELYDLLFEGLDVHIYWKDSTFHYIYCNPLQAHNAGFHHPQEMIGKTDYDIFPKTVADALKHNDQTVLDSGKSQVFEEEGVIGNRKFVFLTQKIPIIRNKEIKGIAGISFDITERKASEEKMRLAQKNAESTLYEILDNLPGHVYWKDKKGVFLGCNKAQVISAGFKTKSDIIGKTDHEFPWKANVKQIMESDQYVISTKKTITREEEAQIRGAKKSSIFLSKKAPLYNESGEVIGVLGISFDITDRKQMEKELHQAKIAAEAANNAKSEFLANISHDIRTPLTGIITFSCFLKKQDKLREEERKELAGDIYHASEQLLNLLNGVLEVVSADSATDHDLNLTSFNLREMLDGLIQLEKPAVKSHNLELRLSIDEKLPQFIVSDKMKVHRILLNLIGNAIKFTEKGTIKLSAKLQSKNQKKATVIFSVEDTGIGIPDEAQPQIFERFYKVNPSYKGKYTGTGIGLNIVQTYLQLLGGQIDFHSTFGKGTIFLVTLTFPLGDTPQEDPEDKAYKAMLIQEQEAILLEDEIYAVENPTIADADTANSALKILLVEDNPIALKSLKVLFMPYKLRIFEADNAEDAFELVKKEVFDLIITDIGLPGMQGDELVAKIRQLEKETGRVRGKITALTGHAVDGELAENCKKAGVDELVKKPMRPALLKTLLNPFMKMKPETAKPTHEPEPEIEPQEKPSSSQGGKLGVDLPDTEAQLFEIDHYPLLDLNVGVAVLGSEDFAKDILKNLNIDSISPELSGLKQAHEVGDWDRVSALAHKMKSGATFGTVRLYHALLYMERYIKAGHMNCAEALYTQMLRVIGETVEYLNKHL